MPINSYFKGHGSEVMDSMQKRYGGTKGKSVFYATAQKRGLKPMAYGGISVPDDPYAGYDANPGAGDEDWRRRLALQQAPGPQMPAPIPAPPPPPSNVPEPPPMAATPPPPPEVNNDPGEPVPDEPSTTLSNGPGSPLADQNTPHSTPTVDAAQPPDEPGSASPASPSPVSSPSTEEGPGPIEPPQQEKPLATSNAFGMGPMRNTGERTKAAIEYGDKILKDPRTGDFKKPSTLQNILGAVLQVSPRTRGIDVHPNLTRQYQNYGMLANQAEEERKSQVAMAQEESHRATGIAALARANRDNTKPLKLSKVEEFEAMQQSKEKEAQRLGFKPGTPEYNKFMANVPATANTQNIEDIADGIISGKLPPDMKGYYRQGPDIKAALTRKGFDLTTAAREWAAVQRHLATLNGPAQERLKQQISFTSDSLDNIAELYARWKPMAVLNGFKIANRAQLDLSKQVPGEMGAVANALDTQIGDFVASLGSVYMGGNLPTHESLKLAAQNMKGDWNDKTFELAVEQAKKNLQMRRNAINLSTTTGVDPNSIYEPRPKPAAPVAPVAPVAPPPPAAPKLPLVGSRQTQAEPPPVAPPVAAPPPAPVPQVAPGVKSPGPATPGPVNVTVGGVTYPFPNQKTADEALAKYREQGGR